GLAGRAPDELFERAVNWIEARRLEREIAKLDGLIPLAAPEEQPELLAEKRRVFDALGVKYPRYKIAARGGRGASGTWGGAREGGGRVQALGRRRHGVRAQGGRGREGVAGAARGAGPAARGGRGSPRGDHRARRARGGRAGAGGGGGEPAPARPLRAHPPRQGAARALPPPRRRLRALFHRGADAAARADRPRRVDRRL